MIGLPAGIRKHPVSNAETMLGKAAGQGPLRTLPVRHSSARGINLQIEWRRAASLLRRRDHQARQPLARLASRRAHALGLEFLQSDRNIRAGCRMSADPISVWSSFLALPAAAKTAMSPLELDGYLTGIVATPQAAPIPPSAWMAQLWGDDEPIFEDDAQIKTVLGAVMIHYNTLIGDIDLSLARLEADRIVDYRPLFLSGDQKPTHDAVRAWVRGFWQAMELAPETWSKLAEDERTKIIIAPFVGFFDLGNLEPLEIPDDIDDRLDEDATLIPRMILLLRRLASIREAASRPAPLPRRSKVGRNDPCPCGSGKKYKRCCGRA